MTQQEYEQKKCECWEEHLQKYGRPYCYTTFSHTFDRAYALGREKEAITQEEIEKAAEEYSKHLGRSRNVTWNDAEYGFIAGANFTLGKHEKDAEGEEILTCEKSKAMQLYSHLLDLVENERMSEHYSKWCDLEREYTALFGENVFADYFGSKCLPNELNEDNFAKSEPKPAEQSMTDSETEHTKDEFATRMQGKFTEQDFTEAKQRTESCMASIPQFELPKQIEAQINKAMESIKAESRKQFGDFGAANADITIPVYRQMMRLGALLVLSARYLESEQTDSDRGDYISMTKPTDPNKCTLFGREKGE